MGKQMEGDNSQRRAAARDAGRHGSSASESGMTTGASKQRTKTARKAEHDERLETTQRAEAKQAARTSRGPCAARVAARSRGSRHGRKAAQRARSWAA